MSGLAPDNQDDHHQIDQVIWQVDVADTEDALALQDRFSDLHASLFEPVIAQVLAQSLPLARHARLDRLEIDLGVVTAAAWEYDAPAALAAALTAALATALAGLDATPNAAGARLLSATAARFERAEHYLLHGTDPCAPAAEGFDAAALLADVSTAQLAGMTAFLRQRSGAPQVLERLVLRAEEATLRRVLAGLEPTHAALILAYLADLRRLHGETPLVALDGPGFARLLWLISLRYLTSGAGSQFNRKTYLGTLLRQVADANGLAYGALLLSLRHGIAQLRRHLPVSASLPAVLEELLRDAKLDADGVSTPAGTGAAPDAGQIFAENAAVPPRDAEHLAAWLVRDPAGLLALIRKLVRDRPALARLLAGAPPAVLARLLAALDPEHARLVQDYLLDVIEAHRQEPLVALEPPAFTSLLWLLAIIQLAREAGSRFNAKSFLVSLLRELAAHEAVEFAGLLASLRRGLALISQRAVPPGPFLGLLDELLNELAETVGPENWAAAESHLRGGGAVMPAALLLRLYHAAPARLAALLRRLAGAELWPAAAARLLAVLTPGEIAGMLAPDAAARAAMDVWLAEALPGEAQAEWILLLRRLALGETLASMPAADGGAAKNLDRMAALAHLLRTGALPWWAILADPPLQPAAAARLLRGLDPAALRVMFAAALPEHRPAMAWRLAGILENDAVAALLVRLAPWAAAPGGPLSQIPLAQRDAAQAHLLVAVLQGGVLDVGALAARLRAQAAQPIPAGLPIDIEDEALAGLLAALSAGVEGPAVQNLIESLAAHGPAMALLAGRLAPALQARLRPLLARGEDGGAMFRAVLALLAGDPPAGAPPYGEALLIEAAIALADDAAPAFRIALLALLAQPRVRAHWAARLPDRLVARLVRVSAPQQSRLLVDTIEVLGAAWRDTAPAERLGAARLPWAPLLAFLAARPPGTREPRALAAQVVGALAGTDAGAARRLLARARALASARGHAWLPAILQVMPPPLRKAPSAPPAPAANRSATRRGGFGLAATPDATADRCLYIGNAGLVLAGPFLPHLFGTLDLLGEDADGKPAMRDLACASRAVHLLQWLVDERLEAPEPELVLNKLLCGLSPETAIEPRIIPSERELAQGLGLLNAMLTNWTIISSSSVEALRETFLQREGRLERREDGWSLQVQRKTLDVLVDRVGWGFGMIFHPWQRLPLRTTW
jgi:hypothetical protein